MTKYIFSHITKFYTQTILAEIWKVQKGALQGIPFLLPRVGCSGSADGSGSGSASGSGSGSGWGWGWGWGSCVHIAVALQESEQYRKLVEFISRLMHTTQHLFTSGAEVLTEGRGFNAMTNFLLHLYRCNGRLMLQCWVTENSNIKRMNTVSGVDSRQCGRKMMLKNHWEDRGDEVLGFLHFAKQRDTITTTKCFTGNINVLLFKISCVL